MTSEEIIYMYGYIYKTTCLVNNKIYVGQHKSKIFDENYKGSGILLTEAIKKYGWEAFVCEILEWCDTREACNEREKFWIKELDALNRDIAYNILEGGEGRSGPLLDTTKKKLSEINCNKIHVIRDNVEKLILIDELDDYLADGWIRGRLKYMNNDIHNKLSVAAKGRIHINNGQVDKMIWPNELEDHILLGWTKGRLITTEHRLNILKHNEKKRGTILITNNLINKYVNANELDYYINLGWRLGMSDDFKDKACISLQNARLAAKNSVCKKVRCIETGEEFDSIQEALKKYHGNITACCKHLRKTAAGYHWEYINEDNIDL